MKFILIFDVDVKEFQSIAPPNAIKELEREVTILKNQFNDEHIPGMKVSLKVIKEESTTPSPRFIMKPEEPE